MVAENLANVKKHVRPPYDRHLTMTIPQFCINFFLFLLKNKHSMRQPAGMNKPSYLLVLVFSSFLRGYEMASTVLQKE